MTLLNTVTNLGNMWVRYFALKAVEFTTKKECMTQEINNGTSTVTTCDVSQDGYFYMCLMSTSIGFLWWVVMRHRMQSLEKIPKSAWKSQ
jgi:hypothetical protein